MTKTADFPLHLLVILCDDSKETEWVPPGNGKRG